MLVFHEGINHCKQQSRRKKHKQRTTTATGTLAAAAAAAAARKPTTKKTVTIHYRIMLQDLAEICCQHVALHFRSGSAAQAWKAEATSETSIHAGTYLQSEFFNARSSPWENAPGLQGTNSAVRRANSSPRAERPESPPILISTLNSPYVQKVVGWSSACLGMSLACRHAIPASWCSRKTQTQQMYHFAILTAGPLSP